VEYMPFKTLSKIFELCKNGGAVVFIKNLPKFCTEKGMQQKFTQLIDQLMELENASLLPKNLIYKAYTYKFSVDNLFECTSFKTIIEKDLILDRKNKEIRYLHRRDGKKEIYFIVNENQASYNHTVTFNNVGKPMVLDPVDGSAREIAFTTKDGKTLINLTLREYDGIIVAFDLNDSNAKAYRNDYTEVEIKNISSEFSLSLADCEYKSSLKSWSDFGHPYFSGEGVYNANVSVDEDGKPDKGNRANYILSLGEVYDLAEVFINQRKAGTLLYSPYELDITEFLVNGENAIQIKVINSLLNEFEKKDKKSGLLGPVEIKRYWSSLK